MAIESNSGRLEKDDTNRRKRRINFANLKHNQIWRENWFYNGRERDDATYNHVVTEALAVKARKIKAQMASADSITAYAPAGAGTPWIPIGPRNINGRIKTIAVHPTNENILYIGAASGGVWKSTDGGESWHDQWNDQETLTIGSIALAASEPDTLYAGTGEWTPGYVTTGPGVGVYKTTNGGSTWSKLSGVSATRIARISVSPTNANRVYVAGNSGLEYSGDGGATWSVALAGNISDVVIDETDDDTIYAAVDNDAVYKSTDNGSTWIRLTSGPTGTDADWLKLVLGVSGAHGSDFLLAKGATQIHKTEDGGTTWSILGGTHTYSWHGWCDLISVAPDDESIIMAGGNTAKRSTDGGATWSSMSGLHADHHFAVFAPSNMNTVYEANDGGLYKSTDKGATWKKASHGLMITQFYDLGSWSQVGTVCGGGTQDQGTNMTTGGLTWKKIEGWDGGYFVIHPTDPRIMYAEHQYTDILKSIDGGDTWSGKTAGITGSNPWTGVITMDLNHPDTLFTGTQRVFRTTDGCATAWVLSSQDLSGNVQAIAVSESDSNRVYAGSSGGTFLRSDDGGATNPWLDKGAGLPNRSIKDIIIDHTDRDRVAVCFGGTNPSNEHIYLSTDGGDSWSNISGDIPNISINALAFDPADSNTIYAGTDVGVYRTSDGGTTWLAFDNGLPNVIVIDLHVDRTASLLIAATFGRGMYKVGIGGGAAPTVDLYLRDSILDTGERFPSPSHLPNPNDTLHDVYWWQSPDIKVDVAPYYSGAGAVFDGVEFDEMDHENPHRTETNRFHLQLHNRGWQNTTNVRVRAFLADASAGLPALPNALTPPDFNLTSTADWTPIGPAQTVPLLEPNRPVIVSWDYVVPTSAATHSCLLAVISSPDDSMANPETNVNVLVKNEKHVCLKNLHVVDSPGPQPQQQIATINFNNAHDEAKLVDIVINPLKFRGGVCGLLLEDIDVVDSAKFLDGVEVYDADESENIGKMSQRWDDNTKVDWSKHLEGINRSRIFLFDPVKQSALRGIKLGPRQKLKGLLTLRGTGKIGYGETQQVNVMQVQDGEIVGGSTYELRLRRAKGLHPVSRVRIVLEKVKILNDYEPWFKGRGDFQFNTVVQFNGNACRRHVRRFPKGNGVYKISDAAGHNEQLINECVYEGYVSVNDQMVLAVQPVERDMFDPDDIPPRYARSFEGPAETWVGSYGPRDETNDPENMGEWMVWYRIESLSL